MSTIIGVVVVLCVIAFFVACAVGGAIIGTAILLAPFGFAARLMRGAKEPEDF